MIRYCEHKGIHHYFVCLKPSTLNLRLLFSAYFKILKDTKTNKNSVYQSFLVSSIVEPYLPSLYVVVHDRTLRPFSNTAGTAATHKIISHKLWIFSFLYLIGQAAAYYCRSILYSFIILISEFQKTTKCQEVGDSKTQLTRPRVSNLLGVRDPFWHQQILWFPRGWSCRYHYMWSIYIYIHIHVCVW